MTVPVAAGATFSPGPPQALPIKTERDFTGGATPTTWPTSDSDSS